MILARKYYSKAIADYSAENVFQEITTKELSCHLLNKTGPSLNANSQYGLL